MRERAVSLRQVMVLTVTGFLAPAAQLLPGLLAQRAGRGAWVVPLLMLPVVILWGILLGRIFREPGAELFSVLRKAFGRAAGAFLTILYIVWAVSLLSGQLGQTGARMAAVYNEASGKLISALLLLLAVWTLRRGSGALYRAGELFWLAAAVAVAGVVLMALPQMKWEYLAPGREDWRGISGACLSYYNVVGAGVFAGALLGEVPGKEGAVRRGISWLVVSSLLTAAMVAAVVGQTGARLAAQLPQPFLIMVQGLSLEGALARLEGPVAALWLLPDFCRVGLLVLALKQAGGNGLVFIGSAAALGLSLVGFEWMNGEIWGAILGFLVPLTAYLVLWRREGSGKRGTSCGE